MAEDNPRLKLRATMEAKKIARMSEDVAHEKLKRMQKNVKLMKGEKKEKTSIMISVLHEELERKIDVYNNMQFGGCIDGGCGFGGGGGSGNDAG